MERRIYYKIIAAVDGRKCPCNATVSEYKHLLLRNAAWNRIAETAFKRSAISSLMKSTKFLTRIMRIKFNWDDPEFSD